MQETKKQLERPDAPVKDKEEYGLALSIPAMPPLLHCLSDAERDALEKRLVRKLDIRLMPMSVLIYILNYLDRNAIAAAKLAGIEDDLGLSSVQFQTCVSILFVGYILMQVPSNLFLTRVGKPALYLPTCMVLWGILCGASGATHNYGGLLACRFLLGFVEAAYFPGCMATLSAWYTSKELSLRTAVLYCGSLLSGAFSGLIAAGITDGMDGVRGLLAWRWLFIIEGSITVVVAFSAYFVLPNFPHNSKGFTEQERQMAMWRLNADINTTETESNTNESKGLTHGFKSCISDPKTWFLVTIAFGSTSSGTISNFFPTVVEGLGYERIRTLLITAPPYLLSCLVAMAVSRNADRTGERYLHLTLPLCVSIAGFIISAATTQIASRYFAMMIMLPGVYTAFILSMSWIANTIPRPAAKRAAALALANAIANCSSIYSPYLYPNKDKPRFVLAMSVNAGTALLAILSATGFRGLLKRANRRLEEEEVEMGGGVRGFRYLV